MIENDNEITKSYEEMNIDNFSDEEQDSNDDGQEIDSYDVNSDDEDEDNNDSNNIDSIDVDDNDSIQFLDNINPPNPPEYVLYESGLSSTSIRPETRPLVVNYNESENLHPMIQKTDFQTMKQTTDTSETKKKYMQNTKSDISSHQNVPQYVPVKQQTMGIKKKSDQCKFPDCLQRASFNYPGKTGAMYCARHKDPAMRNTRSDSCQHDGLFNLIFSIFYYFNLILLTNFYQYI
jgi:hypothetical protein